MVIATVVTADVPAGTPLSRGMRRRHIGWRLDNAPFAARCREDAAAAAILGAQYVHLGLLDAIYRRDANGRPLYPKKLVHVPVHPDDWTNYEPILRQELKQALGGWDGSEVRVFCPLAIGEHVDHILVRSAVEGICESQNLIYFEDYPYVVKPDVIQPQLKFKSSGEDWQSTTIKLTPAEIDARIAAVTCYVSVIPALFPTTLQHWQNRIMFHLPIIGRYLKWSTGLNASLQRMAFSLKSYINREGGERYWFSRAKCIRY